MLAGVLATWGAIAYAAAENDEAWVLRTMSTAMAPGVPVSAERAQRVEFDALPRLTGRRVRIEANDGSTTRGLVERADAQNTELRVFRSDGVTTISFTRADVRAIQVD